ncbi:MAG: hypothetical protein F6K23_03115 [Okeania sp. SIO2C9]|uniref:hypothetical protein n=1 Tax=Okeania sp. SIO2C9 TaxID=2607791 RepID=UPI0013C009D4|nr:hypothetical protein [Okeania sp. SIO2C9]NEQ72152.1 hypothetical protein [Okeania sp. SIO2C9]
MDKKLHPTGITEERIASLRSKLDYEAAKKAKEELDRIMEQRLAKMGLTEEEYVSMFMNAVEDEEECVCIETLMIGKQLP